MAPKGNLCRSIEASFLRQATIRGKLKNLSASADAIILDLEDAVALAEKPATRQTVVDALQLPRAGLGYVRVNAFDTTFCFGDLYAVIGPGLDGIMLLKVEAAAQLIAVDWMISQLESDRGLSPGCIDLLPIVETGKGLNNLDEICSVTDRVKRISFGAGDYTRSTWECSGHAMNESLRWRGTRSCWHLGLRA